MSPIKPILHQREVVDSDGQAPEGFVADNELGQLQDFALAIERAGRTRQNPAADREHFSGYHLQFDEFIVVAINQNGW